MVTTKNAINKYLVIHAKKLVLFITVDAILRKL